MAKEYKREKKLITKTFEIVTEVEYRVTVEVKSFSLHGDNYPTFHACDYIGDLRQLKKSIEDAYERVLEKSVGEIVTEHLVKYGTISVRIEMYVTNNYDNFQISRCVEFKDISNNEDYIKLIVESMKPFYIAAKREMNEHIQNMDFKLEKVNYGGTE